MSDPVRMAFRQGGMTDLLAVYHVVRVEGPVLVAACNQWMQLDHNTEGSVSATSPGMRCHRPACRNRWEVAGDGQP